MREGATSTCHRARLLHVSQASELKGQRVVTIIAGSGPLDAQKLYMDLAKELGLENTYFVGAQPQPARRDAAEIPAEITAEIPRAPSASHLSARCRRRAGFVGASSSLLEEALTAPLSSHLSHSRKSPRFSNPA